MIRKPIIQRRSVAKMEVVKSGSEQNAGWLLANSVKDVQSITSDWMLVNQPLIEGVRIKEVKNVAKEAGHLTEIYRADWGLDELGVTQVFQGVLLPGALSAWHGHRVTTDRLFCNEGVVKIALYDARHDSPTYGLVNEFRIGTIRPALLIVPPQVWHGVKNIGQDKALLINLVDRAYCYEDPDSWRLPHDTQLIPYSFSGHAHREQNPPSASQPHFAARLLLGDD